MSEKIQRLRSRLGQARVAYKKAQAECVQAHCAYLKGVSVALKNETVLDLADSRLLLLRDDLKENLERVEQYIAETYGSKVKALKKAVLVADGRESTLEMKVDSLEGDLEDEN